jgi:hypothetical protein
VDADEREWLERVVAAAERALANLRRDADPMVSGLLSDLEDLRARLRQRLAENPSQAGLDR